MSESTAESWCTVPLIPVVVDLRETSMQRLGATAPATISAMRRLKKVTLGPAQMKDIDFKMSRLKVKGVKGEVIPSSCNTCVLCSKLFKFDGVQQLTRFPTCSHLFHGDCINKWLLATELCPVCQCPLKPKPQQPSPGLGSLRKLLLMSAGVSSIIAGMTICKQIIEGKQMLKPHINPNT